MKNRFNHTKNLHWKKIGLNCFFYFLISALIFTSCDSFVEIGVPHDEIINKTVFVDDATAVAAISGIYSDMLKSLSSSFTHGYMEQYTGLYADELVSFASSLNEQQFASNELEETNGAVAVNFWNPAYLYIFNANTILEGLAENEGITAATKSQLEGEAKFMRAFCHFYLLNLFGPVPLVTTTDFRLNNTLSRSPESEVYEQIITDLTEAKELMYEDYSFAGDERVRPNKAVAIALLARVYLYTGDWANAEAYASMLIEDNTYELEPDLNRVFWGNSTEAIWQLKPVFPPRYFVPHTYQFILDYSGPSTNGNTVALRDTLYKAFEEGDKRKTDWVGSIDDDGEIFYYSFKYKLKDNSSLSEYLMVFRLAEQYLIRAEARAQQGNTSGAKADINVIRSRAGLPDTEADGQASVLAAIEQERRIELFTEWGHRWFDLKRTGRADAVLAPLKPNWEPTDVLFPIPLQEIENNPNLLPQNPGYN